MKLLIVDCELNTAEYLRKGLVQEGCTVDVAHDGIDGRHLALVHDYDAIVLDAMLPGIDGFELLEALRRVRQTPVIMLSARDRVEDRVRGLRAGADDYLLKPCSFVELLARLHAMQRRGRGQPRARLSVADLQVDLIARKAWRGRTRLDLTAKEFSLLAALARREGDVLSKTSLAELVWDMNFDSNTNVVEVAVKRLRTKLDAPFPSKLLHTIRGMGYVLEQRETEGVM